MKYLGIVVGAVWILSMISGCTSSKESTLEPAIVHQKQEKDRSKSLQLFIDGSLKESKGLYADAILDYQEALRYDQDPAIYYALAKDYAALKRYDPAAENALEAIRQDSTKS